MEGMKLEVWKNGLKLKAGRYGERNSRKIRFGGPSLS